MKAVFYYVFGIITTLFAFIIIFDLYAPEFIDDYWLTILYHEYAKEWWYVNVIISSIFTLFTLVWVYNLGESAHERYKHEKLIKDEEEIKPYL